ncbi:unnamed protein product, partial [Staurois parvus]
VFFFLPYSPLTENEGVTKPTTVKSVFTCSKACLLYSLWSLRG